MAGAATIIAQAVDRTLVSFPGWLLPTYCHLRATVAGGAGVATPVGANDATTGNAGTTPGVAINRIAAGVYEVTFPPCKSVALGTFLANQLPADGTFATAAQLRGPAIIDRTAANTAAKLGKIRFAFPTNVGGVPGTELPDTTEIDLSFMADFG